jgi:hypothetical protein
MRLFSGEPLKGGLLGAVGVQLALDAFTAATP